MCDKINSENYDAGIVPDYPPAMEEQLAPSASAESLKTLLDKLDEIQKALDTLATGSELGSVQSTLATTLPNKLEELEGNLNTKLASLDPIKERLDALPSALASLKTAIREDAEASLQPVSDALEKNEQNLKNLLADQATALRGKIDGLHNLAQSAQSTLATTLPNQLEELEGNLTAKLASLDPIKERLDALPTALASLKAAIKEDAEASLQPVSDALEKNEQNLKNLFADQATALRGKIDGLHNLAQSVQSALATTLPNKLEELEGNLTAKLASLDPIKERLDALPTALASLKAAIKEDAEASLQPVSDALEKNEQNLKNLLADQATALRGKIDGLEQNIPSHVQTALLPHLEKIGEQFASADAALRAQIKTQSDQHKTDLGELQKTLQTLLDSLGKAEKRAEENSMAFMETLQHLKGNILSFVTGNADKLQKCLEEQNKTLAEIQKKFDDKIQSLTDQQATMAREQAMAENKLREVTASFATSEKLNGELQSSNKKLEDEINELKTRLDEKKDDITTLKSDLTDSQNKISQLNDSLARLKEDAQNYRDTTGAALQQLLGELTPYAELRDAMLESPSFQELAHQQGIDEEGNLGLLACMRSLGESLEFLNNVHDWAKKVKLDTKPYEPLKADEKRVYAALNECYRKLWQIDFDVFQLPGGQNVLDDFHIVNFVREEVTNLENPRDTDKTYTKDVYVPKLINRAGAKYKSALVKAGNDK